MAGSPAGHPFVFRQLDGTVPPGMELPPPPDPAAILADAEAEADAIRVAARADGLAAARVDAEVAVRAELADAASALAAALAAASDERAAVAARVEEHAVELALRLAEQIVEGTLTAEPARVADVASGALALLADRDRITLHAHPLDLPALRDALAAGDGILAQAAGLELRADDELTRGDVRLRTSAGEVDARLATKLARARELIEQGPGR